MIQTNKALKKSMSLQIERFQLGHQLRDYKSKLWSFKGWISSFGSEVLGHIADRWVS